MYYSTQFKKETQSSRFDRWRINYDLLFRVIEAKEERIALKAENTPKIGKLISRTTH